MSTTELPAWQKGIPLEELKRHTALWEEHDKGLIIGAFTGISETTVAQWISESRFHREGNVAFYVRAVERNQPVKDFAGWTRSSMRPGDILVRRPAYEGRPDLAIAEIAKLHDGAAASLLEKPALWLEILHEHKADREIVHELGARHIATKIPASSELISWWVIGDVQRAKLPFDKAEELGLVRIGSPALDIMLSLDDLAALDEASASLFAAHYSTKQKGQSWSALSLRGYQDDPTFIAKPSEMSKKWKAENAEALKWELRDTSIRGQAPFDSLEPIIAEVPGKHHRIRLMRLAPGGGELTRHADITDPDAGVADGKLVRFHIPLKTNPEVRFEQWLLSGKVQGAHMGLGEIWTLDTRKPHRAWNAGEEERVHLVVDTESGPQVRAAMLAGRSA